MIPRTRSRRFALLSAPAWLLPAALLSGSCSTPAGGGSTTGGSATSTGGNAAATGGSAATTGGISSTGGAATGGTASPTGGSTSTGGTAATTGGSAQTGGTPSSGGSGGTSVGGSSNGGSAGAMSKGGSAGASTGGSGGGSAAACTTPEEDKFSFFVISLKALIRECGADTTGMFPACGGDLGGLAGADMKCQHVAEFVSPCQAKKTWHAFLSTSTVNAIDRIGMGPWYDRRGRVLATTIANLITDRPTGADAAIKNDLPNEDGFPNQTPDGSTTKIDNHELLTGTGSDGKVYTQNATPGSPGGATGCGLDVDGTGTAMWSVERATCWDWTRKTKEGCPRVGHPWCNTASCTPAGSGSGTNWMSVWNESGCAPGGKLTNAGGGGIDTQSRQVGSAGGYGAFYCFAVTPTP